MRQNRKLLNPRTSINSIGHMSNERLHEIERIAPDIRAADERKFVKFGFRLQLGPKGILRAEESGDGQVQLNWAGIAF